MAEHPSFIQWLKRLRSDRDVTQEDLAEQVGCSVKTISALESGQRRPSRAMAERLATVLALDPNEREEFLQLARLRTSSARNLASTQQHLSSVLLIEPDPPPAPRSSQLRRLPRPLTTLIGREAEQAVIHERLADPACRLLTLVGPGGIGKTRLSLQVAADLGSRLADGVAFVPLAQVMAPEYVATAIADVLGCPLLPMQTPEEALIQFLRDRELLLVLDNLEHLLDATPLVAAILPEAPQVRLLVTSRERLRLGSEWVIEVNGLPLPPVAGRGTDSRPVIDNTDAMLLFVERARQVSAEFALTPANRVSVAQICRLLDGMPLGIELAAAWVRALSPGEIAAELSRGLDFLRLNDRNADPRQRSMRAVIDHSWALLTPDEQRVMARLAVFRGGCLRPAAETVASATLPTLLALFDKSLLHRTPTGRYELHELVRQYAAEQLAADPREEAAVQDHHCMYYSNWIKTMGTMLRGPEQQAAVEAFMGEIDNLRAAWQYAVDHRKSEALGLMHHWGTLAWFYELQSWYQESETMLRQAADMLSTPPPETHEEELLLAALRGNQGWCAVRRGHIDTGLKLLEESVQILRLGDNRVWLFFALVQLTYLTSLSGDFERSVALVDEHLPLAQQLDDPWSTAHALFQRAVIYVDRAPDVAYTRFNEGLPHIRAVGDRYLWTLSLNHLGEVALALGKVNEAQAAFAEALERSAEVANGVGEVLAHNGLALVAIARGAWAGAITHSLQAVARSREVGEISGQAKALITLGEAQTGAGDTAVARHSFKEAIRVSLAARSVPTAIDAWVGLAMLDIHNGQPDQSLLMLLALIRRHPVTRRPTLERVEGLWTKLTTRVGRPTLASANEAAQAVGIEQLGQMLTAYTAHGPVAPNYPKHLHPRAAP